MLHQNSRFSHRPKQHSAASAFPLWQPVFVPAEPSDLALQSSTHANYIACSLQHEAHRPHFQQFMPCLISHHNSDICGYLDCGVCAALQMYTPLSTYTHLRKLPGALQIHLVMHKADIKSMANEPSCYSSGGLLSHPRRLQLSWAHGLGLCTSLHVTAFAMGSRRIRIACKMQLLMTMACFPYHCPRHQQSHTPQ